MKIIEEFKKFAVRGSVVDLAVGVIIGGAFGKIVSSLVSDVIMPPIGLLLGGLNFSDYKWALSQGDHVVTLNYGAFVQNVVDFLIVAFVIFLIVKGINRLRKKEDEKPQEPPEEVKLLREIRDSLKGQNERTQVLK